MSLADPSGEVAALARGVCHGRILELPVGKGGFGYDPLFVARGVGRSMAELEPQEKAHISHRGHALRSLRPLLKLYL